MDALVTLVPFFILVGLACFFFKLAIEAGDEGQDEGPRPSVEEALIGATMASTEDDEGNVVVLTGLRHRLPERR